MLKFICCIFCLFSTCSSLFSLEELLEAHPLNRTDHRTRQIAVCMVFQNEADYLQEWLEYHMLIGVEHFYLYNNLSTDDYLSVLRPYIEEGVVELFEYGVTTFKQDTQTFVYQHALNMAKEHNQWLAIIDADEFICPVKEMSLKKVLTKYTSTGGVNVFWQVYGTSHVEKLQGDELMIERLVYKYPPNWIGNKWTKSIVRTKYVDYVINPHWCKYVSGIQSVFPDFTPFAPGKRFAEYPIDDIRLNHYWFRTQNYFEQVKKPRQKKRRILPSPEQLKRMDINSNKIKDDIMLKFVPALKKRLKARKQTIN